MSPAGPEWFAYHTEDYAGRLLLPDAINPEDERQAEIVDELLGAADQASEEIIPIVLQKREEGTAGRFGMVERVTLPDGEDLAIKICPSYNIYTAHESGTQILLDRRIGESMLKANVMFGAGAEKVDLSGRTDERGRPLPIIRGVQYHGSFIPDSENTTSPFVHIMAHEYGDSDLGTKKRDGYLPDDREREKLYNEIVRAVGGDPTTVHYDDVQDLYGGITSVGSGHYYGANMFVRRAEPGNPRLVLTKFDMMARKKLHWPSSTDLERSQD